MKIVLVGYMGSGKSTIGKSLAADLDFSFIDLDAFIEKNEKLSISDIFKSKGEIYFRKIEGIYLKQILTTQNNIVLSTGGGTPCYGTNIEVINANTQNSFYLKLSIGALMERLKNEKDERPIIQSKSNDELQEFIGKHLFERSFYYNQVQNTLDCNLKSVAKIVSELKKELV